MPFAKKQKTLTPLDLVRAPFKIISEQAPKVVDRAIKKVNKTIDKIVNTVLPEDKKEVKKTLLQLDREKEILGLQRDLLAAQNKKKILIPQIAALKSQIMPKNNMKRKQKKQNGPVPKRKNTMSLSNFARPAQRSGRSLTRPVIGASRGAHGRNKDVIEETEYIMDLSATSASFALINNLPFNPAQSSTFPWAASIAKQYEKWVCDYVKFIYKPTVSEYATLGQQGKVIMSFDYDASDSPPSTKQQAEDIQEHVDGLPCEYRVLTLKPKMLMEGKPGKYCRAGALPGGSDIKSFDGGNLYISTSGLGATSGTLGELHVSYKFHLVEPILSASSSSAPNNNQVAQFVSVYTGETLTSSTATTLALATTVTNGISAVNSGGSIALPPGNYLLTGAMDYDSTAAILSAYIELSSNSSGTYALIYPGGQAAYGPQFVQAAAAVNTAGYISQTWYLSVNAANVSVRLIGYVNSTGSVLGTGSLVILAV